MLNDDDYFKYIDTILDNDNSINNIDFLDKDVIVEDSEGNIVTYKYSDKLSVRVFQKVKIETLNEIVSAAKNKKIYSGERFSFEADATFNLFSDEPFCDELKNEDLPIFDNSIFIKYNWGLNTVNLFYDQT